MRSLACWPGVLTFQHSTKSINAQPATTGSIWIGTRTHPARRPRGCRAAPATALGRPAPLDLLTSADVPCSNRHRRHRNATTMIDECEEDVPPVRITAKASLCHPVRGPAALRREHGAIAKTRRAATCDTGADALLSRGLLLPALHRLCRLAAARPSWGLAHRFEPAGTDIPEQSGPAHAIRRRDATAAPAWDLLRKTPDRPLPPS